MYAYSYNLINIHDYVCIFMHIRDAIRPQVYENTVKTLYSMHRIISARVPPDSRLGEFNIKRFSFTTRKKYCLLITGIFMCHIINNITIISLGV